MEMDQIVKRISKSIGDRNDDRMLFLICGDHGMSDQGSHGGASQEEVETPFIFFDNQMNGKYNLWLVIFFFFQIVEEIWFNYF